MSDITISSIKNALNTLEGCKTDKEIIGIEVSSEKRIESLESRFYHARKILQDIVELMESRLKLDQIIKL